MKINLALTSICILLTLSSNALCQDIGSQENTSEKVVLPEGLVEDESDATNYLVEYSDTVTKFKVPIKYTPISIQTLNRGIINDQLAESVPDLAYNISGVQPALSVFTPFLIRGFRAQILRDGLTQSSILPTIALGQVITNIERIEFIKGPNSILSGTTSSGGLVNLVTKQPLPYFYSSAYVTIGSFDFYKGAIDISTPLSKDNSLLFRINASYRNSDSFRDFITSERVFIAPILTWDIKSNMKLTLNAEYLNIDEPIDGGIIAVGDKVANIPFSRNLGEPTDDAPYEKYFIEGTLETGIRENITIINTLRYFYTDSTSFSHIPFFLQEDNKTLDRLIFQSLLLKNKFIHTKNDLLIDIDILNTQNDLVLGIEYKKDKVDSDSRFFPTTSLDISMPVYNQQEPFQPDLFPILVRNVDTHEAGMYIQDFINYRDKLFILAGLRVEYYKYKIEDSFGSPDPNILISAQTDGFEILPRFGVLYRLHEKLSFYGNYTESLSTGVLWRSFEIGGGVIEPETAWQLEGGIKLSLLDDKLLTTLALYNIVKHNAYSADPTFGPAFAVQVDKERSRGVEFDITGEIFRGLNIIASYSYIDAEVIEDDFFPDGNKLAAVPKHSGSIWATYKLYSGPLEGLGVGAGIIGVGKREGDLINTFELDGFARLDAALYYERVVNENILIKASINFKNITDKQYIASSESRFEVLPGIPFSVFGNIRVEFF